MAGLFVATATRDKSRNHPRPASVLQQSFVHIANSLAVAHRLIMSNPQKHQAVPYRQIFTDWMMGSVLGVLCAGLLLATHIPEAIPASDWPSSSFARLAFLIAFGISFGLGAAMTGVMFFAYEKT
jgi:hypothetical protein